MSFIVPMEKPKRCGLCPCFHAEHPMHCQAVKAHKDKRIVAPYGAPIPDWCPLIELHPHGRLIDATFEENHYASMLLDPTPDVTVEDRKKAKAIIDAIRMAKTVIEAEGEKDGR